MKTGSDDRFPQTAGFADLVLKADYLPSIDKIEHGRMRLRFGLLTVVNVIGAISILLAVISYQINWVRQRVASLDCSQPDFYPWIVNGLREFEGLQRWRGWLGDFPVEALTVFHAEDDVQSARLRQLFPESSFAYLANEDEVARFMSGDPELHRNDSTHRRESQP